MNPFRYIFAFAGISVCGLISTLAFSQSANPRIDSLLFLLKNDKPDTGKITHLNLLCREYINLASYDSALNYGNEALRIASSLPNEEGSAGAAFAYNNIGLMHYNQDDYPRALDYYFKALKIDEDRKDKTEIVKLLGNIGNVYLAQTDSAKALDYYFKALKMAEELGNKNLIASTLGNIGIVYYNLKNDAPKALDYYFKALKMTKELRNKNLMVNLLGNIGDVYKDQRDYTNALDCYFKTLKLHEERNNKNEIVTVLTNIGSVYKDQGNFPNALDYYFKSLKMAEELGNKNLIANAFRKIGSMYFSKKIYSEAEIYFLQALKIDKETGALNEEKQIEEALAELYEKTGKEKLAVKYYKNVIVLKDTLFNIDKNNEITRMAMSYEFEKLEAAAKARQDKDELAHESEARGRMIVLVLTSGLLILVLIFAVFILSALRITRKQKIMIEYQKKIAEEKQKEILDSIHYASRIQAALLPTEKYIEKSINRLMKKS